jgi:hypothetical protein
MSVRLRLPLWRLEKEGEAQPGAVKVQEGPALDVLPTDLLEALNEKGQRSRWLVRSVASLTSELR